MKRILFFFGFLLFSQAVFSCSCSIFYPFCHVRNHIADYNVIQGEVIDTTGLSIIVLVEEVYRGNESRDTVEIWDNTDDTSQCNFAHKATNIGMTGDRIIFMLPIIDSLVNPWDVIGDYRRMYTLCQTNWLRIWNDSVYGYINGNPYIPRYYQDEYTDKMPYTEFKSWLDSGNDCIFLDVEKYSEKELTLDLKGIEFHIQTANDEFYSFEIIDLTGRQMFFKNFTGSSVITSPKLYSGIFVAVIRDKNGILRSRMKFKH